MVRLLCTWQQKAVWRSWRKRGLFVKETQLNEHKLKNKSLLTTDKRTYTNWNRAAEKGSLETLEALWILAKEEELNPMNCFKPKVREDKLPCMLQHTETM